MKEPGRRQSMGLHRVGHDWGTSLHFSLSCIGEGNGNPLQCSCLENPRDGETWWAAVYGVPQSQTWLKWLSSIVIHIVKGFGIVNKAEIDVFFCKSLVFSMIQQMLAIWSLVPLPFLEPAWTSVRKFMVHVLLKPGLENFEHYFTSMWDECNCAVVWAFFGIAFLWD